MVNLELYRVFYTVAKCGSLTKAAQELYISQPAVSQAIRQLENQLGTTLFNRVHKGMELTKQGGELVFEDVSRALQLLDGVESRLSELKKSAKGTLRIGASETIFQYILADKLVRYHALYPDVKFELLSDVSPITIEQLKTDRCDVGFLNFPIPEDDGIVVRQTITLLNDVFIGGKGFERFRGRQVPLWELQNEPLLLRGKERRRSLLHEPRHSLPPRHRSRQLGVHEKTRCRGDGHRLHPARVYAARSRRWEYLRDRSLSHHALAVGGGGAA